MGQNLQKLDTRAPHTYHCHWCKLDHLISLEEVSDYKFLIYPKKSALFVDLFYSWVLQSFNLAQLGIGHVRVLGSQMKTILKVGLAMKS